MKKTDIFKFLFFFLLIVYVCLYFTSLAGYYEYKNYKKMTLTAEQIEKFEEDVKAGKEVDVEDYVVEEKKVFNNKIANVGRRLSYDISSTLSKVLTKTFKTLSKFIDE